MTFARPWLLLLLLALPLWWWWRAQRLKRMPGAPMSDVRPASGPIERLWIARLPVWLRSLCLGAWIVAAAGPRLGSARQELRSEGISIVLAVDISSSMLAEDFSPANRLDVARRTATEFVRARASDRIGLVAFAGQALTQVPITTDYQVLEEAIRQLRVGILEDGTAIGTAIATAANRLRRAPGKSKVVILLTDGENNKGRDPMDVLRESNAAKIRVHMVGVDLEEEVRNKPQVQRLFQSVGRYGGRYFNAATARDLERASRTLDQVEKGALVSKPFVRDAPVYDWFAVPALVCLALAIVLRAVPFFIDYT